MQTGGKRSSAFCKPSSGGHTSKPSAAMPDYLCPSLQRPVDNKPSYEGRFLRQGSCLALIGSCSMSKVARLSLSGSCKWCKSMVQPASQASVPAHQVSGPASQASVPARQASVPASQASVLASKASVQVSKASGRTDGKTNKRKIFPFYRTLLPIGAAAQKRNRA